MATSTTLTSSGSLQGGLFVDLFSPLLTSSRGWECGEVEMRGKMKGKWVIEVSKGKGRKVRLRLPVMGRRTLERR